MELVLTGNKNEEIFLNFMIIFDDSGTLLNSMVTLFWL